MATEAATALRAAPGSALLRLDDVAVRYGAIEALRGISLVVGRGEVVTLIGANGAGKSTTLRAISGLVSLGGGRITFDGEEISRVSAHLLVARGIAMSPEGRGVFANLTVLENLRMGAQSADRRVGPRRPDNLACGYDRAYELRPADGVALRYAPAGLTTACPVAAALFLWERDVVQPAAQSLLGERVTSVDHFGSYSCRRLYGRADGDYSEHATANAVDVAGFRLASGRRITVLDDWLGSDEDAAFLRAARSGACDLFSTVLSPDYNAAHADHIHFDQAQRGASGWRGCR